LFFEELPQVGAALLFGLLGGASLISVVSGALSLFKLLPVLLGRPLILGLLANRGKRWRNVSSTDIQGVMRGARWLCHRETLTLSMAAVLNDPATESSVIYACASELAALRAEPPEGNSRFVAAAAIVRSLHGRENLLPVIREALEALGARCKDAKLEALSFAMFKLKHSSSSERLAGIEAISADEELAAAFAPDFVLLLLDDKDSLIREAAGNALGKSRALGVLADAIKNPLCDTTGELSRRHDVACFVWNTALMTVMESASETSPYSHWLDIEPTLRQWLDTATQRHQGESALALANARGVAGALTRTREKGEWLEEFSRSLTQVC